MVSHWSCAELSDQRNPWRYQGFWNLLRFMAKDEKLVVLVQVLFRLIVDAPIDCKNLRVEFVKETSGMSGFVVLAIKQVAIDSGKQAS